MSGPRPKPYAGPPMASKAGTEGLRKRRVRRLHDLYRSGEVRWYPERGERS